MQTDVMKLCMSESGFDVQLVNDSIYEFYVKFKGPEESGVWRVHVELPDQYPFKSPSIGFMNKIFHPNIDELSGSVCLDVINQTWSPMFDMVNIFEQFLPQLLRYPNPSDPLNGEAANMLMREPKAYEDKVKYYVQKYATKALADSAQLRSKNVKVEQNVATDSEMQDDSRAEDNDDDDDDEISDAGSYGDDDDDDDDPSKSMDL